MKLVPSNIVPAKDGIFMVVVPERVYFKRIVMHATGSISCNVICSLNIVFPRVVPPRSTTVLRVKQELNIRLTVYLFDINIV